jgi:hypothetical protein
VVLLEDLRSPGLRKREGAVYVHSFPNCDDNMRQSQKGRLLRTSLRAAIPEVLREQCQRIQS